MPNKPVVRSNTKNVKIVVGKQAQGASAQANHAPKPQRHRRKKRQSQKNVVAVEGTVPIASASSRTSRSGRMATSINPSDMLRANPEANISPGALEWIVRHLHPTAAYGTLKSAARIPDGALPQSALVECREVLNLSCPFVEGGNVLNAKTWGMTLLHTGLQLHPWVVAAWTGGEANRAGLTAILRDFNTTGDTPPYYPIWRQVEEGVAYCVVENTALRKLTSDLDLPEIADKIRTTNSGWNIEFNSPEIVNQGWAMVSQAPPNVIESTVDGVDRGTAARRSRRMSDRMVSFVRSGMRLGPDFDSECIAVKGVRRHPDFIRAVGHSRAAEVNVSVEFTSAGGGYRYDSYLPLSGDVQWTSTGQWGEWPYDNETIGQWAYDANEAPEDAASPPQQLTIPAGQVVTVETVGPGNNRTVTLGPGTYFVQMAGFLANTAGSSRSYLRGVLAYISNVDRTLVGVVEVLNRVYTTAPSPAVGTITLIYDNALDLGHQQIGEVPPLDTQNAPQTNPKITVTQLKQGCGLSGSANLWNIVWTPVDTQDVSPVQFSDLLTGDVIGTGGPHDLFDKNIGWVVIQIVGISQATTVVVEIRIDTELVAAPESPIAPFMEEAETTDMQACEIMRSMRGMMPWGFDGDRAKTGGLVTIFKSVAIEIAKMAAKDLGVATQQVVAGGHSGLLGAGLNMFGLGFLKKPIKGAVGIAGGLLNTLGNLV